MLRLSSRHVKAFTNRNRNDVTHSSVASSVSISRQWLCALTSDVGQESSSSSAEKEPAELHNLLKKNQQRNKVVQATNVMSQMADLKKSNKISKTDYEQDARFVNMVKMLESTSVSDAEPLIIIKGLKALSELGLDNESFCVKNLENSLMWTARSCSIKELMMLLSFTMGRRETESQNKLFNEVCKSLERRWVEIKGASPLIVTTPSDNFWVLLNKNHFNYLVESGKDTPKPMLLKDIKDGKIFNSLFYYSEQFSPQFIARLEDRISDIVDEIAPGDLVLILSQLGKKRRRNVPLLKTISFYICKHKNMLDVKQISDCLFSFNQLSFKDKNVVESLCNELVTKVPEVAASAVLRSILMSLGQLKYLHAPLIDAIMAWYTARQDTGTPMIPKDLTTLVLTLASLNYIPHHHSKLLEQVAMELSQLKTTLSELVWLDSVWSLTVIGHASNDHLKSVLNQTFQNVVLLPNNKNVGATLKLLNINAAAKLLYPDYDGPTVTVEEDALIKDVKISPSSAKLQFNQTVLEAVRTLCPDPKYSSLNVNTLLGFVAEADIVLNDKAQPLAVADYSNHFGHKEPAKPLPEGSKRLAVLSASFQDCLLGGELSGLTAFNVRLLEAAGYQVLLVKHTDWTPSQNQVSRVSQIDQRMRNIVGMKP